MADLILEDISGFSNKELKQFDCNNKEMNLYLHRYAKKNSKNRIAPCQILISKESQKEIFGYLTMSASTIEKKDYPEGLLDKFPRYPIPVLLISRLAISINHSRKGYGSYLLMHSLFQFQKALKNQIGMVGVVTDAIDESAVKFYLKYDFQILDNDSSVYPKKMFISAHTIGLIIDASKN